MMAPTSEETMITIMVPANMEVFTQKSVHVHEDKKLQLMVQKLKQMDSFWHSDGCPPPTLHELQLYGLILSNVNSYLLLYLRENVCKEHMIEDARESEELVAFSDLRACHISDDDISGSDLNVEILDAGWKWDDAPYLLAQCRSSILKKQSSEGTVLVEIDSFNDNKVGGNGDECCGSAELEISNRPVDGKQWEKSRGDHLFDILAELEKLGHQRSYAPPETGQFKYYREIREHIMSSLILIEAKSACQENGLIGVEGEAKWNFLGPGHTFKDSCGISGWNFASAIDEMPEFIVLLKKCASDLEKVFSTNDLDSQSDNVDIGICEEVGAQASNAQGKNVAYTYNFEVPIYRVKQVSGNDETKKSRTRSEYLQDILQLLRNIGGETQLTFQEVRLYAQLEEHVSTSIWMFASENRIDWREIGRSTKNMETVKNCLIEKKSMENIYGISENMTLWDESSTDRQWCFRKIVSLVNSIKSHFLDMAPDEMEITFYRKIRNLMVDMEMKIFRAEEAKQHSEGLHYDILKHSLKTIYGNQRKVVKFMDDVLDTMMKTIVPTVGGILDLLEPYKEDDEGNVIFSDRAVREIEIQISKFSNGLKKLERAILILRKAGAITCYVFIKLFDVNDGMDNEKVRKRFRHGAELVCRAVEVWKWNQDVSKLLDI